jgi:hypothetical protein
MEALHELYLALAMEQRARRAAKRVGLTAKKSRWRANSIDNYGGFCLVEARTNAVMAGARYDMTAEEVIEFCADDQ